MKHRFSTGWVDLDNYLGGVRPGDSILLVHTAGRDELLLWKGFLDFARIEGTRVLYPGLTGSREYLTAGLNLDRLPASARPGPRRSPPARLFSAATSRLPRGGILILDDLSDWALALKSESRLLDSFRAAAAAVARKQGLLFSSVSATRLSPGILAGLKDVASISLEIHSSKDGYLLVPLNLRDRLADARMKPFGLRLTGKLAGQRSRVSPVRDFEATHGERIRAAWHLREEVASQILGGPLGESGFGLAVADLRGTFRVAGESLRRLLHIAADVTDPVPALVARIPSTRRRSFLRFLAGVRRSGEGSATISIPTPRGGPEAFHVRATAIEAGLTLFLVDRAGAEQSVAAGIDASPVAIAVADRKRFHAMNRAMRSLIGLSSREALPALGSVFDANTLRRLRSAIDESAAVAGTPSPFAGHLRRTDGSPLPVRITAGAGEAGDGSPCVLSIEDFSEYARKIANLEVSDARFRAVAERLSTPVALLEGLGIVYRNPRFDELIGAAAGAPPPSLDQLVPPSDREEFKLAVSKFLGSRQSSHTLDVPVTPGGGQAIMTRMTLRKVPLQGAAGLLLEVEDVTERRREAERISGLQAGAERITSILEAATRTLDYGKLLHAALDRSLDVLGWTGGAVYVHDQAGKEFKAELWKHVPRGLLEKLCVVPSGEGLGGFVAKTLESHIVTLDKYPSYLPFGQLFREHKIRRISLIPLVHEEMPVGFILGLSTEPGKADTPPTETLTMLGRQLGNAIANARKLATVRESEQRLHTVVESLSGIVYTAAPDGTILTIDAAVTPVLGYAPRDFHRNRALFLSLIHEEDKKIYLERVTGAERLGSGFVREYRIRPKAKAAFRWMRDTVSVMRAQDGNVLGFTGILSDVTADRERLDTVVSEHGILRTVQDVLPEGIAVFTDGGECVEWNPTMERISGTTRAGAIGKSAASLAILPNSLGAEGLRNAVAARAPSRLGLVQTPAAPGSWYEVFLAPVPGRGDAGPGFLIRYADVTARQMELEQLLRSEKILLNVINAMDDVMMITDLNGRVVEVNQAFLKVMRYTRSQAVGQEFPYPWLVEKDMSRFLVWIARIREQQWLHDFDVTWCRGSGEEVQMSLNTTLIRNSLGEPVAMLNIARDITERIRLTRDVEARNLQIEMINRIITLANGTDDFAAVFAAVAAEVVRLMPAHAVFLASDAPGGDPFSGALAFDGEPLDAAGASGVAASFRRADGTWPAEGIVPDAAGDRFRSAVVVPAGSGNPGEPVLVVAAREPHVYGEEQVELLRPLAGQLGVIIGRFRLFDRVRRDSEYVGNLLDSIESPVYTVDTELRVTRLNRAATTYFRSRSGASQEPLEGAPLFGILPDGSVREALRVAFSRAGKGDVPYAAEEASEDSPEGVRTVRLTVNTLTDGRSAIGFVVNHTDITTLKATERELRSRAEQLITLHEISTVISNTHDLDAVLASSLSLLRGALRARGMMVYFAGGGGGELFLAHQDGFGEDQVHAVARLHPERSITGAVLQRRTPRYVSSGVADDTEIAPENRLFLRRHSIEAMAVVPIVTREEVLGALDIFYDEPHEFTEGERRVLNLAGNQLGAAIENVRLYDELKAQVDRLSVLFDLSRKLTSLLDTGEIYAATFEHIRRVVPCDRCVISLYDAAGGTPAPVLLATREGAGYRVERVPGTGGAEGAGAHATAGDYSISVPMASDAATIGVIEVARGDGRPYDEVQIRLLESFGSLAAIAVQKAGLYEETVRTSRQIEQRNRELDDFTYVVSHDLKEPLISIEGFSRILQADYSDVIREEGREYLDSLVGATTRMKGLIDDLLMLSRVSRTPESFTDVDLPAVVAEVRTDIEFVLRKRNVRLEVDPALPRIRGSETHLKILFRNLIGNAVKFNDKPEPVVEVGFRSQGNNLYLFWVRDNGIGIDPEFFEKIFVIFQRLHRREEFEGSGAGLAIVRKIIEIHKGTIWVESKKGAGSTFYFTLPAAGTA